MGTGLNHRGPAPRLRAGQGIPAGLVPFPAGDRDVLCSRIRRVTQEFLHRVWSADRVGAGNAAAFDCAGIPLRVIAQLERAHCPRRARPARAQGGAAHIRAAPRPGPARGRAPAAERVQSP